MKQHNYLRSRIVAKDLTHGELAGMLGLSPGTFSLRLCGKGVWTLKEAYTLMRILDIPDAEMALAFPDYYTEGNHEIDFSSGRVLPAPRKLRRIGDGSDNVRSIQRTSGYRFDPVRADRH